MMANLSRLALSYLARLRTSDGLGAKAARGSTWLATGAIAEQALRMARNVALARMLAPEAFGTMAIVLAVSAFVQSFTDLGINTAIVQSPRAENKTYLNGAWWLSFGRAVGLYVLIFVASPWIADFYADPELALLIRVAFLAAVFNAAVSPLTYVAQKKMDFRRYVVINQGGALCGIVAAVVCAFLIRGVWALAAGFVIEAFARAVLSYVVCPFRPGVSFDRESLQALFRFSRGMVGLPILYALFTRLDTFVIGKLSSPTDLGIYSLAATLAYVPYAILGKFMADLTAPAFSAMQKDSRRLKATLLRITHAMALLLFPLLVCAAFYGSDVLFLLYGPDYTVAAVPFTLMFGTYVLQLLVQPVVSLYFMIGRPAANRTFLGIRASLMTVLIYPAVKFHGLTGAAAAGLISFVIGFLFHIWALRRIIALDVREYGWTLVRGMALSLPVALVCAAARNTLTLEPLANVGIALVICGLGYILALTLFARRALSS